MIWLNIELNINFSEDRIIEHKLKASLRILTIPDYWHKQNHQQQQHTTVDYPDLCEYKEGDDL